MRGSLGISTVLSTHVDAYSRYFLTVVLRFFFSHQGIAFVCLHRAHKASINRLLKMTSLFTKEPYRRDDILQIKGLLLCVSTELCTHVDAYSRFF